MKYKILLAAASVSYHLLPSVVVNLAPQVFRRPQKEHVCVHKQQRVFVLVSLSQKESRGGTRPKPVPKFFRPRRVEDLLVLAEQYSLSVGAGPAFREVGDCVVRRQGVRHDVESAETVQYSLSNSCLVGSHPLPVNIFYEISSWLPLPPLKENTWYSIKK